MPRKSKRPCKYRGCPRLTDLSSGYCEEHEKIQVKEYDKSRRVEHNQRYGAKWRKLRKRFLLAHPLCEQCRLKGKYTIATEVHHILPLSAGGTHDERNLMPLCKSCHSRITLTTENVQRR